MKAAPNVLVVCALLLAFASLGKAQRPEWNIIRGTVVDESNGAVVGAEVCVADPVNGGPCSKSTTGGNFSIVVDRAGTYPLSAQDFDMGYPYLAVGVVPFYGKLFRRAPDVIVKEISSPEPIKIVLGPQAGRLIVTIIDDATNKAIDSGSVTQCRVNEPKSCWKRMGRFPNGQYELLTPEVPFTISFATWEGKLVNGKWADGKWVERKAFDGESGLPVEVLHVDLGARKEITLRLKRKFAVINVD
jgi:hypothetical protein